MSKEQMIPYLAKGIQELKDKLKFKWFVWGSFPGSEIRYPLFMIILLEILKGFLVKFLPFFPFQPFFSFQPFFPFQLLLQLLLHIWDILDLLAEKLF